MPFPQVNFAKGEIAQELRARFDVQAYGSAVARARNVRVKKYGGLEKRPGTRFVAEVYDDSQPVRLFPFQFSLTQTYALEFGQGYMRIASGGGMVLNEELAITGMTSANPVQVTAAYHGYVAGDQVYFSGLAAPWDVLNGRFFTVLASTGTNTFTIDYNGTALGPFAGSTGGTTRTSAPAPPPSPPVVPPPVEPDPGPSTGGGGGMCVSIDALILMANGQTKPAGELVAGDMVRTQHEDSMVWGSYRVLAVQQVVRDLWRIERGANELKASAGHRVYLDGRWQRVEEIGTRAGTGIVAQIDIADANTYVSNGFLSHNIKMEMVFE